MTESNTLHRETEDILSVEKDSIFLQQVDSWDRKAQIPASLVDFYGKLLAVHSKATHLIGKPKFKMNNREIEHRLKRGLSLVTFDKLELDVTLLRMIFRTIVSLYAAYPNLFKPLPKDLVELVFYPRLKVMVRAWYFGRNLPIVSTASDETIILLEDIIQATLKPFLSRYSAILINHVNQDHWRRGYCPICGGIPDLAFLDNDNGARWLACSRCDTRWVFQRLGCPFCGNDKQDTLAYFTNEGPYRIYVCEECQQYLKTKDLRQAQDQDIALPLERLFTLFLDDQAQKLGFKHGIRNRQKL